VGLSYTSLVVLRQLFFISLLGVFTLLHSTPLFAQQRLEDLITLALKDSEILRAVNKNIESLQAEIRARDIVLSGQLTLQAENFQNNQDAVAFARRARSRFIDLIYDQPFSTGTMLSMTTGHDRSRFDNFGIRNTADWEVRLTQSLWKDAFGNFTTLRRKGDQAELYSRKAALLYEQQLIIIDLEAIYWDLVVALKEEDIRLKNIEYSKNLQKWTRERVQKTAAEKSDLLQAQALLSSRELDLVAVRNQIEALRNRIRQVFPTRETGDFSPVLDAIDKNRSLSDLLADTGNLETPRRLDSIASEKMAVQAEMEAKKVREQLKPQLDAYVSYGQNGIANTFDNAWARAGNDRFLGVRAGVLFKVPLNRRLTGEQERAAELAAEASRMQAQYRGRESRVGWDELQRRLSVLKQQVQEATRLAEFQTSKVLEERRRFRLGRSTVFQLVTFEVEAAEAEVRKYRFLADLRKNESQARLFTRSEEGT
jgi:outer membrane protein